MKRILVDINHPAHVHLFRHFIAAMQQAGHEVVVAAKQVPAITSLLNAYGIPYVGTGRKHDGLLLKYLTELNHLAKLLAIVVRRRIDYGVGVSMVLPVVSRLTRMKSIALDDDDQAVTPISARFIAAADLILTPSALGYERRGPQHVCHPSYHELAYLHPNRFRPDPKVLTSLGIDARQPFFVMRFNAFKAHHDVGVRGLSPDQKKRLVQVLSAHGRVFITTERAIEPELEAYKLPVSPEKIHSLLYYATLFVGDSQTMTTEAALLGTPALKLNSFAGKLSIPNELEEKYGLCYAFRPEQFDEMLQTIETLLANGNAKQQWQTRLAHLLTEKVDLTTLLIKLVSNYSAGATRLQCEPVAP